MEDQNNEEQEEQGTVDLVSVLYVVGGIPFMIFFFVALFTIVGSCDQAGISFPA
jgi:hypothetical protein